MKRLRQTIHGPEKGNCFATCVSMITDIPIEDVPIIVWNDEQWWPNVCEFLKSKGWASGIIKQTAFDQSIASVYALVDMHIPLIVTGKSPRYDCNHCVVQVGDKVYDPHESNSGVLEPYEDIIFLIPSGAFKT